MNFIQEIKSTKDRSLHIILDDEEIIVHHLGKFGNQGWYSWTVWGPTEGTSPNYNSQMITEHQILERISLLMGDEPLKGEEMMGIDIFFGRHMQIDHD